MKLLYTLALLLSFGVARAQEIGLFDKDGKAIAYIDTEDEDMPVYLYDGKPVAYIDDKNNLYGFNGKHLGWYDKGIIRNHYGLLVGTTRDATFRYTGYEPYKSYKQPKPYMTHKSYPPSRGYMSMSKYAVGSFEEFLLAGIK